MNFCLLSDKITHHASCIYPISGIYSAALWILGCRLTCSALGIRLPQAQTCPEYKHTLISLVGKAIKQLAVPEGDTIISVTVNQNIQPQSKIAKTKLHISERDTKLGCSSGVRHKTLLIRSKQGGRMRPYHISNTQVLESKADCVNRKGLGYTDTRFMSSQTQQAQICFLLGGRSVMTSFWCPT